MLERPDPQKRLAQTGHPVGVDVGLKSLAALSTGALIENPRWLRESLTELRRLQRHAARQIKGSQRQKKTDQHLARQHEHIARKDYSS